MYEYAQKRSARQLGLRVWIWRPYSLEVEFLEFIQDVPFLLLPSHLCSLEVVLLFCDVSNGVDGQLSLPSSFMKRRDFSCGWWWVPLDSF